MIHTDFSRSWEEQFFSCLILIIISTLLQGRSMLLLIVLSNLYGRLLMNMLLVQYLLLLLIRRNRRWLKLHIMYFDSLWISKLELLMRTVTSWKLFARAAFHNFNHLDRGMLGSFSYCYEPLTLMTLFSLIISIYLSDLLRHNDWWLDNASTVMQSSWEHVALRWGP